jgi:multisubunit Na+/H+ antiporter MnhC subunit
MSPAAIMAMSEAQLLGLAIYGGALGLVVIGLYAAAASRHLMRVILGLLLIEAGVTLFLVAVGYRPEAAAPILQAGEPVGPMVDPIPQALALTAIVIGVGVLALALSLVVRVHQTYGTLDTRELAELIASATGELPAGHQRAATPAVEHRPATANGRGGEAAS